MIYINISLTSSIIPVDFIQFRMFSPIFKVRRVLASISLIMGHANMLRQKMLSSSHKHLRKHKHLRRHRAPVPVLPVVLLHL